MVIFHRSLTQITETKLFITAHSSLCFYSGSVINYGEKMENVSCSSKQYMVIKSANYGDFNQNGVFNDDKNVSTVCSAVTTCRMKSRCNGNQSCEQTVDNSLLPPQHCLDNSKEVYIKYTCGDSDNSSLSTEGNPLYNWK